MKKSTLNVITLALVLINLILTVILVSTNKKTNSLISKIAEIINLDVAGGNTVSGGSNDSNISDITYVDVINGEDKNIIVSFVDTNGKTHQAVLTVSLGLNSKAKDYEKVNTAVNNGMKLIISKIRTEANEYTYSTISANQSVMEANLLKQLQDLFQTETITNVLISMVIQ